MSLFARLWDATALTNVAVTRGVTLAKPNTKTLWDVRTDETLDINITLTFTAVPIVTAQTVSSLVQPAYTGTLLVADMNHVVEINFDTPVRVVTFSAHSPTNTGCKLFLELFNVDINADPVASA